MKRRATAKRLLRRAPWLLSLVALVLLVAFAVVAVPARVRIPPLEPRQPGVLVDAALFSHLRHAPMSCYACHPSLFPQALVGFTHREMQKGRYCGACHDGAEAKAMLKMACQECHVPER